MDFHRAVIIEGHIDNKRDQKCPDDNQSTIELGFFRKVMYSHRTPVPVQG